MSRDRPSRRVPHACGRHLAARRPRRVHHVKKLVLLAVSAAAVSVPLQTVSAEAVTDYANCAALNKVYPHGVGLKNAHDHTSGTPVTNFARKPVVYRANKKSDRDGDGIA